ncbi:MAG: PfkB family carbohydrate kinase, partial [Planctomycetota bacterium]
VDYLVLNETEMEVIAGSAEFGAAAALLDTDVGYVVLTRGKQGLAVLDEPSDPLLIPGHRVQSVDAVGAGDAFVGTLAAFLAEGRSLAEALALANAAAALSVTKEGAQPSLPRRRDILGFAGRSSNRDQ